MSRPESNVLRTRPLGVTIIGFIGVLWGILAQLVYLWLIWPMGALAGVLLVIGVICLGFIIACILLPEVLGIWVIMDIRTFLSVLLFLGLGFIIGAALIAVAVIAILALMSGLIGALISWNFLKGKFWAWALTVFYYGVASIATTISPAAGPLGPVVGVLFAIATIYLLLPHVRAYFRRQPK